MTAESEPPPRIAASLGMTIALVLFTCSGAWLRNTDAVVYVAQAESLWPGRSVDDALDQLPPYTIGNEDFLPADRWGQRRGRFPPGIAICIAPGVALGHLLWWITGVPDMRAIIAVAWICALLGTGAAALYAFFLKTGLRAARAIGATLIVVLGNAGIWLVTDSVWPEALVAAAMCVVWWLASECIRTDAGRVRAALGLAIGTLPWLHASMWIPGMVLAMALWYSLRLHGPRAWLVPVSAILPAALLVLYNWIVFDAPLRGGYIGETGQWSGPESGLTVVPRVRALITYHYAAAICIAGLVVRALPARARTAMLATIRAPRDLPESTTLAATVWAALLAALAHLAVYAFRRPVLIDRLMTPLSFLAAPGIAVVVSAWSGRRRVVWLLASAAITGAILYAMFDGRSIRRIYTETVVYEGPDVWWYVLAMTRSAPWWGAGVAMVCLSATCIRRLCAAVRTTPSA